MTQLIKTVLHCLREELDISHLAFSHPKPRALLEPQWGGRSLPYVIFRVAVAIYFFLVIIFDGVTYEFGSKWLIFLTDWFYVVITSQSLLLAFAVTFHYERATRAAPGDAIYSTLAWPLKILWFIQNLCLSGAILITLVYWGWTIYVEVDTVIDLPNVTAHGLITLYVLVDSFLTGIPVRLLHFYQPPLLGISYAVFSWVYWACGGTDPEGNHYVYSMMDYTNAPKSAVGYSFMMCLISMFLHLCMWFLYRVRIFLYTTLCCGRCCCCMDNQMAQEQVTEAQLDEKLHLQDIENTLTKENLQEGESENPWSKDTLGDQCYPAEKCLLTKMTVSEV